MGIEILTGLLVDTETYHRPGQGDSTALAGGRGVCLLGEGQARLILGNRHSRMHPGGARAVETAKRPLSIFTGSLHFQYVLFLRVWRCSLQIFVL